MSEALANLIDLEQGWLRVCLDEKERAFVRNPYERLLIEQDISAWLGGLRASIVQDRYSPASAYVCDVPKAKGTVRTAVILTAADRVLYGALAYFCLPQIKNEVGWSQGEVAFAYRLAEESHNGHWFSGRFEGWELFKTISLKLLEEGFPYVVMTDLAAFYDNIDISLLISDLSQLGIAQPIREQLSSCFNRWARGQAGRGIPQGHSASDIFAKLYLNTVDENLRHLGYIHVRYVDDTRIFCRTLPECKRALVDLTRLLRPRGLFLQSAKSEIFRADKARTHIEGVRPILETVKGHYVSRIALTFKLEDPYLSLQEAEDIASLDVHDETTEVIREAYQAYFKDADDSRFDKTLFHFLLRRLGKNQDKFALQHCVSFLEKHPEETEAILDYIGACNGVEDTRTEVVSFVRSDFAVYPYQLYQILEWVGQRDPTPSSGILDLCRKIGFDGGQPQYLRSVCRKLLADHGTPADLERMENHYPLAQGANEQSEILCCLRRMERGRRNAFIARAENDNEWNTRAVRFVRSTGPA